MGHRRFRTISTTSLRGWLRAIEACPQFVPFVRDLRIAVRSELWIRDQEAELEHAWFLSAAKEWNA